MQQPENPAQAGFSAFHSPQPQPQLEPQSKAQPEIASRSCR
ncbi:hypothetical protein TI01_0237 [Lysobacter sp. A03]|nr:hypothetical protein TI01_0237 [Lysobacter sp. A03]